jgi:arsenite methyltransferase
MPLYLRPLASQLQDEILARFYGCGSPIPSTLTGKTVLDLGCGTGRDSYLCSKLVGPTGRVIGVDMTGEQLEVAKRHVDAQTKVWGFERPNISFRQGYIEDLASLGIEDASVDVVISNCVINLSPDKGRVLSEALRVLKPGGELYFSDVFAGRRVPKAMVDDPVLYGECLSGALYVEDFRRLLRERGVLDWRTVNKRRITIENAEVEQKVGHIDFWSLTVRVFKLALEDLCEDYGQVATYLGTDPNSPNRFVLDDHHVFEKGRPMLVCGNTASMVQDTRYGAHFEVRGDRSTHFGPFPCGPSPTATSSTDPAACGPGGACC